MNGLLAASSAFFFLHLFPSTPLRRRSVAIAGEGVYSAVFSILSLAALYWAVVEFNAASPGEKLLSMPVWWIWLKAGLILFASILLVGGLLTPNPSSPGAEKVLEKRDASGGIFAITRHPVMWGFAIWAVAHLLSQGTVRGLLFFGALAATALIGSWLQQRRKRATVPGWADFEARTSFIPFAAIVDGRAHLSFAPLGWWRVAIGVAVWAAALHFHAWIAGVPALR
ncbi:NnrU family protein [Rhodomicrobium vannielii ATCC 17100]|uniref:NnrU family protein n=1 Tax=Rhodomicrobium vannielii (strain ATCC 17100 / DSM 162 / LMG 4299 / NCIMB 10020 / ATH 3.1.1) TaxID=648757 RepID=E3I8E8_RHOVT|nr:NnrU family protein [Rhodomicrobium vannielii]ADP70857.1 NnrU family protein [Rhodomicrobium vannielii ATCC 17100]